jgi:L-lactate utilization protein LutC
MTSPRDAFLARVREAVTAGNRPGTAAEVEPRGPIGYQGAGADPVVRFRDELTAAGGQAHLVADKAAAVARVVELVRAKSSRRVLVGSGPLLDALGLADHLRAVGVEAVAVAGLSADSSREPFFGTDLAVSGVNYLIAETGSIALLAGPSEPRSLSLLPPVHIAVAGREQLLPDVFDLFELLALPTGGPNSRPRLPSCLTLITGPSKTGDIELRLVTGVHGPGEVHVVLVTG